MKIASIQINDKCGPMLRGEFYREPLEKFFKRNKLGEVTGGGTLLQENGQPAYCEIELSIKDETEEVVSEVKNKIDSITPKGSILYLENEQELPVGNLEGVALNLHFTKAPQELLDKTDFQALWDGVDKAIASAGKMHDTWEGPETFTIYYYGIDADKIISTVQEKLEGHEIGKYIEPVQLPFVIEE